MTTLHFNYKDVFRAPRLAFSPKKMWVQFLGFLAGWLGYFVLTYFAAGLAGAVTQGSVSCSMLWESYRLAPLGFGFVWWAKIIWALGIAWFVAWVLLADSAVSKITFEQLQGNDFYEVKEAWGFALKNWASVVMTPVAIFLFAAFFAVCGIVLGLWGKIPWVGEVSVALLWALIFPTCLFIAFLLVVLFFSRWLAPAVVGTTKSDTFDTIFECFSCVASQAWRLVVYSALLGFLMVLGGWVFFYFCGQAFVIAHRILGAQWALGMGQKYTEVFAYGLNLLPPFRMVLVEFLSRVPCCGGPLASLVYGGGMAGLPVPGAPGVNLLFHPTGEAMGMLPLAGKISGFITGISLWLLFLFLVSYPKAISSVGYSLIFIVLTKKKDNKNLLEKKEKKEEWKMPEVPKAEETKAPEAPKPPVPPVPTAPPKPAVPPAPPVPPAPKSEGK